MSMVEMLGGGRRLYNLRHPMGRESVLDGIHHVIRWEAGFLGGRYLSRFGIWLDWDVRFILSDTWRNRQPDASIRGRFAGELLPTFPGDEVEG